MTMSDGRGAGAGPVLADARERFLELVDTSATADELYRAVAREFSVDLAQAIYLADLPANRWFDAAAPCLITGARVLQPT